MLSRSPPIRQLSSSEADVGIDADSSHRSTSDGDSEIKDEDAVLREAMLRDCVKSVTCVLPNVCPDYATKLAWAHQYNAQAVIDVILGMECKDTPYPLRGESSNPRKRKRPHDSIMEILVMPLGEVTRTHVESLQTHFGGSEWVQVTASSQEYHRLRSVNLSLFFFFLFIVP